MLYEELLFGEHYFCVWRENNVLYVIDEEISDFEKTMSAAEFESVYKDMFEPEVLSKILYGVY